MKISLFLLLSFIRLNSCAQNFLNKSYTAKVSASCSMMTNGGCMKYSYCSLSFETDSVTVYYSMDLYCSFTDSTLNRTSRGIPLTTKKYAWQMKNGTIAIKGFNTFGSFTPVTANELAAKKEMNYGEWIDIYFTDQLAK